VPKTGDHGRAVALDMSNVAPMSAYIEEDELLLCFALDAALVLISVVSAAVWGTILSAALISRLW
jgi:hypothetical protein